MKGILCRIAVLLMVASGNIEGGKTTLPFAQDNPIKIVKPAVNENGWKIPGLNESEISSVRKRLAKGYGPASVPVYVTVFRPKRKFITTIPIYRVKNGQTLIVAERKVLIDGILKCDVDGRTFMYILQCTIILEESNGRTGYSGQFGVHYYDGDGDGKFESFEEGAPFIMADLRVPDWVLSK